MPLKILLRLTDADGMNSYSRTVAVRYRPGGDMAFTLYPNPSDFQTATWLKVEGVKNNISLSVGLYNMQGTKIWSGVEAVRGAGACLFKLGVGQAPLPGVYTVLVMAAATGTIVYQQKLIVR